jgi:fatty acid-binding protein DegV
MSVKIIVDSTVDVKDAVKQRLRIVPLTVHFGGEEFVNGTHAGPGAIAVAFFRRK